MAGGTQSEVPEGIGFFYDVSRLFIRIRNYCTTAGHNYSISAEAVRAVMYVCAQLEK